MAALVASPSPYLPFEDEIEVPLRLSPSQAVSQPSSSQWSSSSSSSLSSSPRPLSLSSSFSSSQASPLASPSQASSCATLRCYQASSNSSSVESRKKTQSVSRYHLGGFDSIETLIEKIGAPVSFELFTESFIDDDALLTKNRWLLRRTDCECLIEDKWYLKENARRQPSNGLAFELAEAELSNFESHKQLAQFKTFRLFFDKDKDNSSYFVDISRFGQEDYYLLLTLKNDPSQYDFAADLVPANAKVIEYLLLNDSSKLSSLEDKFDGPNRNMHFPTFPVELIRSSDIQKQLLYYGPDRDVDGFEKSRIALHDFLGAEACPYRILDEDFMYMSDVIV